MNDYNKIANPAEVGLEMAVRSALGRLKIMSPDGFCSLIKPEVIECDEEALTLTMAFEIAPWELNPNGIVHGGVISGLLDTTMGYLVVALTRIPTATISQTTSYLRPARPDARMIVRSCVEKRGRSIIFTSAKMWSEAEPGKPVATAEATYTAT